LPAPGTEIVNSGGDVKRLRVDFACRTTRIGGAAVGVMIRKLVGLRLTPQGNTIDPSPMSKVATVGKIFTASKTGRYFV
jgi:hypothetical protein